MKSCGYSTALSLMLSDKTIMPIMHFAIILKAFPGSLACFRKHLRLVSSTSSYKFVQAVAATCCSPTSLLEQQQVELSRSLPRCLQLSASHS